MKKQERISKLLANYGPYSRREADALIAKKQVWVNNELAILGQKITLDDKVVVDGKKIVFKTKPQYFIVNKPKGYICQKKDKYGREVISLIDNPNKRNLFTVGRLDVNTTGLIIVTTDGEFARKINAPDSKIPKTYLVFLKNKLSLTDLRTLKSGVILEDGYKTKPAKQVKVIKNDSEGATVKLTIIEGKKNQIRRMFLSLDNTVVNLKRIAIGNLKLDDLPLGKVQNYSQSKLYNLLNIS